MTPDQVVAEIATILHRWVHPTYTTVQFCTFCHAAAARAVEGVGE